MSGASGAYQVEIQALQACQNKILSMLDQLTAQDVSSVIMSISGMFGGSSGNNGLGNFPEAETLGGTYNQVMNDLMDQFKEITDLVTTMANVLGKSATNYQDTEDQLTQQFNSIVQKYQTQSGSFAVPGTATSTTPSGTAPQPGVSTPVYTASTGTPAAQTTPVTTADDPSSGGGSTDYTSGPATTSTTSSSNTNYTS